MDHCCVETGDCTDSLHLNPFDNKMYCTFHVQSCDEPGCDKKMFDYQDNEYFHRHGFSSCQICDGNYCIGHSIPCQICGKNDGNSLCKHCTREDTNGEFDSLCYECYSCRDEAKYDCSSIKPAKN